MVRVGLARITTARLSPRRGLVITMTGTPLLLSAGNGSSIGRGDGARDTGMGDEGDGALRRVHRSAAAGGQSVGAQDGEYGDGSAEAHREGCWRGWCVCVRGDVKLSWKNEVLVTES